MRITKKKLWHLSKAITVLLSVLTFTPLVIPYGKFMPLLFGMPYTLAMGVLFTVLLVVNTWLATFFHPGNNSE